jgi:hypothetical protein
MVIVVVGYVEVGFGLIVVWTLVGKGRYWLWEWEGWLLSYILVLF